MIDIAFSTTPVPARIWCYGDCKIRRFEHWCSCSVREQRVSGSSVNIKITIRPNDCWETIMSLHDPRSWLYELTSTQVYCSMEIELCFCHNPIPMDWGPQDWYSGHIWEIVALQQEHIPVPGYFRAVTTQTQRHWLNSHTNTQANLATIPSAGYFLISHRTAVYRQIALHLRQRTGCQNLDALFCVNAVR